MLKIASTDKTVLEKFTAASGGQGILIGAGNICESLSLADLFLLYEPQVNQIEENCHPDFRPSIVVLAPEQETLPPSFLNGFADDLLVLPLRAADIARVVRMHEQMQILRTVEETTKAVPELVRKIQEDVHLAQKIQRRLIREKFSPIGGLAIKSKYWCGLKSGGDYFDVFEFPDQRHVGIILADSSSYSLSTAFIGSLMQFSVHVGQADITDPAAVVAAFYGKLQSAMKEKDKFSVFYGILDKKTYHFRFVECGPVYAALKNKQNGFQWLAKGENPQLTLANGHIPPCGEVLLEPGDRMTLVSDGWAEALEKPMSVLLPDFFQASDDPQEFINSMAFRLRKGAEKIAGEGDDSPMPPQDCSVLLFDLAKNLIRLAK